MQGNKSYQHFQVQSGSEGLVTGTLPTVAVSRVLAQRTSMSGWVGRLELGRGIPALVSRPPTLTLWSSKNPPALPTQQDSPELASGRSYTLPRVLCGAKTFDTSRI